MNVYAHACRRSVTASCLLLALFVMCIAVLFTIINDNVYFHSKPHEQVVNAATAIEGVLDDALGLDDPLDMLGNYTGSTAGLPFLKQGQPSHSRVSVYHFVDSEDVDFGARWLYGVEKTASAPTNVLFDVGRTLAVQTHDAVNDAFGLGCPCPDSRTCPLDPKRYARTLERIRKLFDPKPMPCTQVHPLAILRARSHGYHSIQILAHEFDTAGVDLKPSANETAQANAKFEIIDLTSAPAANWAGQQFSKHYYDLHGQPCRLMSRRVLPQEHKWFGPWQRLLSCAADHEPVHKDGPEDMSKAGTNQCLNVKRTIRFARYWEHGATCARLRRTGTRGCNPMDPAAFASQSCAFTIPKEPFVNPVSAGNISDLHSPRVERFRTCALVSSSGTLVGSKCGADIDSHDAVWRMNVPVIVGFEQDVGARADFDVFMSWVGRIIAGPAAPGYAEAVAASEFMKINGTLSRSVPYSSPPRPIDLHRAVGIRSGGSSTLRAALLRASASAFRWNASKFVDADTQYTKAYQSFAHAFDLGWVASTGLRSLLIAGSMCDEVSTYGFTDLLPGQPYHYWEGVADSQSGSDAQRRGAHQMDREHVVIETLAQMDHVPVCPRIMRRRAIQTRRTKKSVKVVDPVQWKLHAPLQGPALGTSVTVSGKSLSVIQGPTRAGSVQPPGALNPGSKAKRIRKFVSDLLCSSGFSPVGTKGGCRSLNASHDPNLRAKRGGSLGDCASTCRTTQGCGAFSVWFNRQQKNLMCYLVKEVEIDAYGLAAVGSNNGKCCRKNLSSERRPFV